MSNQASAILLSECEVEPAGIQSMSVDMFFDGMIKITKITA